MMLKKKRKSILSLVILILALLATGALAQETEWSGAAYGWRYPGDISEAIEAGGAGLDDVRRMGLEVFTGRFTRTDGYGDGPFDLDEWLEDSTAFGHRASLQGNGLLLRINGLDAQSCNECHSIVSHRTNPPRLGIGGVGGVVQNAIIMPSLIDVADSGDDRVSYQLGHEPDLALERDGTADFNGRFANPPFLFGGGGVEALAKEMTVDLQELLETARNSPAGTVIALDTHDVHFGTLMALGGGEVDLSGLEGVGPKDTSGFEAEEVLVVRPFGRKGDNFSMRDFDRGAMQFHFGIQPVEVVDPDEVGGVDEDGDGVTDEIGIVEMSALHVFDVTNPVPRILSLNGNAQAGFDRFLEIGCSSCHRPVLETRSREFPLAHPEVPTDPAANVYLEIDLETGRFRAGARRWRLRASFCRLEAAPHGARAGRDLRASGFRAGRVHDGPPLGSGRHRTVPARRAGDDPVRGDRASRRRGAGGPRRLHGAVASRSGKTVEVPEPTPGAAPTQSRAVLMEGVRLD